jgi:hypothetical protein
MDEVLLSKILNELSWHFILTICSKLCETLDFNGDDLSSRGVLGCDAVFDTSVSNDHAVSFFRVKRLDLG